ncbi:MAG: GNAT family N-acetyltransferase [Pseudomonadota bacterium]|nr:GNAT family N-acetyltransferase [Pseudomonadota bacterium]
MTDSEEYRLRSAAWPADIALLREVREAVFVIEQKVPIELEWDDLDAVCEHVLAIDNANRPIGTGRLSPDGLIGRMAVLRTCRGMGVGSAILRLLLAKATARKMPQVILNAQISALTFYERFGFITEGPEFMDAGIPHRKMRLKIYKYIRHSS